MIKKDSLKLTNSKKVDRREAKHAEKEFNLEDDYQPSLRFVHETEGEVALFFNGTFGLCAKNSNAGGHEEIKVISKNQPAVIYDFGDPAKSLMATLALGLDILAASAGRELALHMLKAHIDQLVEQTPIKDKVARKTLRKYKMHIKTQA
jgi:hypothetical protein